MGLDDLIDNDEKKKTDDTTDKSDSTDSDSNGSDSTGSCSDTDGDFVLYSLTLQEPKCSNCGEVGHRDMDVAYCTNPDCENRFIEQGSELSYRPPGFDSTPDPESVKKDSWDHWRE